MKVIELLQKKLSRIAFAYKHEENKFDSKFYIITIVISYPIKKHSVFEILEMKKDKNTKIFIDIK